MLHNVANILKPEAKLEKRYYFMCLVRRAVLQLISESLKHGLQFYLSDILDNPLVGLEEINFFDINSTAFKVFNIK